MALVRHISSGLFVHDPHTVTHLMHWQSCLPAFSRIFWPADWQWLVRFICAVVIVCLDRSWHLYNLAFTGYFPCQLGIDHLTTAWQSSMLSIVLLTPILCGPCCILFQPHASLVISMNCIWAIAKYRADGCIPLHLWTSTTAIFPLFRRVTLLQAQPSSSSLSWSPCKHYHGCAEPWSNLEC